MTAEELALRQEGLVAHWQLLRDGWTDDAIRWWARGLRRPHDGVYLTGWGPVTARQRWWAATLSTPASFLSHGAAAAAWELRADHAALVTITRPGACGPVVADGLLVRHSASIAAHASSLEGLRITTPARTIIDLQPRLAPWAWEKVIREALRRGVVVPASLLEAARTNRGRRGVGALKRWVETYSQLPFARCRSDAEAFALTVLDDAGYATPRVNETFAGHEADLCWPGLLLIIEIDGPQWHRFKERDAIKTEAWTAAGFKVRRIPSDELFADPRRLLLLVPQAARSGPARIGPRHRPTGFALDANWG